MRPRNLPTVVRNVRPTVRPTVLLTVLLIGAALVLAACDGEEADTAAGEGIEEEATGLGEDPGDPEEGEAAGDGLGGADDSDTGADDEPSFVEVDEAPPRFAHPDADPIELRTSGAEGGPWPVLEWETIDGAESYGVTLYAASGDVYWRWRGPDTEVRVGGFPEEPEPDAALAPRVEEGMTWDVVARDDDGSVIAQSGERPISP